MVQCIISANYFTEIYSLNKNKPISNRFKGFYKNVRFVFFGKKNTNFLISYFTSFFKELLFLKENLIKKAEDYYNPLHLVSFTSVLQDYFIDFGLQANHSYNGMACFNQN